MATTWTVPRKRVDHETLSVALLTEQYIDNVTALYEQLPAMDANINAGTYAGSVDSWGDITNASITISLARTADVLCIGGALFTITSGANVGTERVQFRVAHTTGAAYGPSSGLLGLSVTSTRKWGACAGLFTDLAAGSHVFTVQNYTTKTFTSIYTSVLLVVVINKI